MPFLDIFFEELKPLYLDILNKKLSKGKYPSAKKTYKLLTEAFSHDEFFLLQLEETIEPYRDNLGL
jgi:hypothetical protein